MAMYAAKIEHDDRNKYKNTHRFNNEGAATIVAAPLAFRHDKNSQAPRLNGRGPANVNFYS
jgi:hypothetical protein